MFESRTKAAKRCSLLIPLMPTGILSPTISLRRTTAVNESGKISSAHLGSPSVIKSLIDEIFSRSCGSTLTILHPLVF